MKKFVFFAILVVLGFFVYLSTYQIPYFTAEETFSYNYVFLNPLSNKEEKMLELINRLKNLNEKESEFDKNILIDKVIMKDNTAIISIRGKNLYSSSYNEIRIIRQLSETVRVNFKNIEKIKIEEEQRQIFQHIDIENTFDIKKAVNLGEIDKIE
jgi:hypothetical protein